MKTCLTEKKWFSLPFKFYNIEVFLFWYRQSLIFKNTVVQVLCDEKSFETANNILKKYIYIYYSLGSSLSFSAAMENVYDLFMTMRLYFENFMDVEVWLLNCGGKKKVCCFDKIPFTYSWFLFYGETNGVSLSSLFSTLKSSYPAVCAARYSRVQRRKHHPFALKRADGKPEANEDGNFTRCNA